MSRLQFATVALLGAALGAGCFGSNGQCQEDWDCLGGEVCANTHECAAAGEVSRVAIRWTVRGSPANPTVCAPISQLEVTILDTESSNTASYTPVPCAPGIFTFSALPTDFDRVILRAYVNGGVGDDLSATIVPGQDVQFDLSSGDSPAVDAGVPPP